MNVLSANAAKHTATGNRSPQQSSLCCWYYLWTLYPASLPGSNPRSNAAFLKPCCRLLPLIRDSKALPVHQPSESGLFNEACSFCTLGPLRQSDTVFLDLDLCGKKCWLSTPDQPGAKTPHLIFCNTYWLTGERFLHAACRFVLAISSIGRHSRCKGLWVEAWRSRYMRSNIRDSFAGSRCQLRALT